MSLQKIIRDWIIADQDLIDLIPAARWLPASSVSGENVPERLFAVMRWGVVTSGVGKMRRRSLVIWIHDDLGTYEDVNKVLTALDGRMDGASNLRDGDGNEVMSVSWLGTSGDLSDTGFRTITRNITFEIVGKEA